MIFLIFFHFLIPEEGSGELLGHVPEEGSGKVPRQVPKRFRGIVSGTGFGEGFEAGSGQGSKEVLGQFNFLIFNFFIFFFLIFLIFLIILIKNKGIN